MFDWLYPYADKLRFPDEVIETQFRKDYHANTVGTTRLALVLGLILYSLFGILDVYAIPISKEIVWMIRYGIVAPVIIMALVALPTSWSRMNSSSNTSVRSLSKAR